MKITSSNEADILMDEEKYDSPSWHKDALKEVENRMKDGIENVLDWDTAKKNLRNKFE
jgi:translation elongation factor P/translation initiation factor 5A